MGNNAAFTQFEKISVAVYNEGSMTKTLIVNCSLTHSSVAAHATLKKKTAARGQSAATDC